MTQMEKVSMTQGLGLTALLAALGGGGYYAGAKALEDYDIQSPFQSPLKTKPFSATKLKELAKDPSTYLTLLALMGGGYGAYNLGKRQGEKDALPGPQLTDLLNYR